jgi:hypothetical protein
MSVTRLLPKPSVSRDDVTHLAWDRGWRYHDMFAADDDRPFEKIWLTPNGETGIHWIEDHILDLSYLLLEGERQEDTAREIASAIPTYGREDLRELVEGASDWDDFMVALQHVAAAAPPEFDPEIFGWFEQAFEHEHPTVRKIAALSTAYPAWPEFRALLAEAANNDDVPEVRDVASRMLEDLDEKLAGA